MDTIVDAAQTVDVLGQMHRLFVSATSTILSTATLRKSERRKVYNITLPLNITTAVKNDR